MGDELKEAGISKQLARTIGVAVDYRRKNRSTEGLQENVARLKLYKSKLMVLPRKSKAKKGDTTRAEAQNVPQNTTKEIIPLRRWRSRRRPAPSRRRRRPSARRARSGRPGRTSTTTARSASARPTRRTPLLPRSRGVTAATTVHPARLGPILGWT